tara:strand:+ start:85 stop:516 length:432 start_codon:yes stop_codon:yes gene_type:complete
MTCLGQDRTAFGVKVDVHLVCEENDVSLRQVNELLEEPKCLFSMIPGLASDAHPGHDSTNLEGSKHSADVSGVIRRGELASKLVREQLARPARASPAKLLRAHLDELREACSYGVELRMMGSIEPSAVGKRPKSHATQAREQA